MKYPCCRQILASIVSVARLCMFSFFFEITPVHYGIVGIYLRSHVSLPLLAPLPALRPSSGRSLWLGSDAGASRQLRRSLIWPLPLVIFAAGKHVSAYLFGTGMGKVGVSRDRKCPKEELMLARLGKSHKTTQFQYQFNDESAPLWGRRVPSICYNLFSTPTTSPRSILVISNNAWT